MGIVLATFLVLAVLLGQDFPDIGPTGAERPLFFGLVAIALTCGFLSELAIVYWRFRPRGRGTAIFLLGGALANTLGAIIPAAVAYYVLASTALDQLPHLLVLGFAGAWILLGAWFVSSRLVTQLRRSVDASRKRSAFVTAVAASVVSAPISWMALVALYGAPTPAQAIEEQLERPAAVRQLYAKFPSDALGIEEPIDFVDSETKMGGNFSTTVMLEDAKGATLCLEYVPDNTSVESGVFLMRRDTSDPTTSRRLTGAEESALYGLLLRWESDHPASELKPPLTRSESDRNAYRARQIGSRLLALLDARPIRLAPARPRRGG